MPVCVHAARLSGPLRAVLRCCRIEFDGRQNGDGDFDEGTYIQRSNVVTPTPHWRDPPALSRRARAEAVVPVLTLAELLEHQYFAPISVEQLDSAISTFGRYFAE